MKLLRKIVLLLIVVLLAVACYPDVESPQRPTVDPNPTPGVQDDPNVVPEDDADVEETQVDDGAEATEDADSLGTAGNSNIAQPLDDSELEDVTARVTELQMHLADEGSRRLELILTFVNNSDEEVTLDYVTEDYRLRDADGTEITPTAMSSALSNPSIPANESVSGELEFPTLDAGATYTLILPDFEEIVIDASVEPETAGDDDQFP